MATKTQALAPGEHIPFAVPGSTAVVTVQATETGTYTVVVAQGAHRPDGWSYSYADETTARFEATRAAQLFHRHGSADAIEAHRQHLVEVKTEQERRSLRRMHNATVLAEAEAELDTLHNFGAMVALAELKARMNALYAA